MCTEEPALSYAKWFTEMAKCPSKLVQFYGICSNFKHIFGLRLIDAMRACNISFEDWPPYSGNINYPIPAPEGFKGNEISIYEETSFMYDKVTEYGQARRELLHWLAEQFTEAEGNKHV